MEHHGSEKIATITFAFQNLRGILLFAVLIPNLLLSLLNQLVVDLLLSSQLQRYIHFYFD